MGLLRFRGDRRRVVRSGVVLLAHEHLSDGVSPVGQWAVRVTTAGRAALWAVVRSPVALGVVLERPSVGHAQVDVRVPVLALRHDLVYQELVRPRPVSRLPFIVPVYVGYNNRTLCLKITQGLAFDRRSDLCFLNV